MWLLQQGVVPIIRLLGRCYKICTEGTQRGCSLLVTQCRSSAPCANCLNAVLGGDLYAVATGWLSDVCMLVREHPDGNDASVLVGVMTTCPRSEISTCQRDAISCMSYDSQCAECVMNSSHALPVGHCQNLLSVFNLLPQGEGGGAVCQPCPRDVKNFNQIVIATSLIGGLSVVACLLVGLLIIAYGRDLVSMQDRIILGLVLANAVFSSANVIPINLLSSTTAKCGQLALPFNTILFGRAWWFFGKFMLVGFEFFVISVSIWALVDSEISLHFCTEALLHLMCVGMGGAAFAVFYMKGLEIEISGYNRANQEESQTSDHDYLAPTDDADDAATILVEKSSRKFLSGRDAYDELLRNMLLVWNGCLALSLCLWVGLRLKYCRELSRWRKKVHSDISAAHNDEWWETRRSQWRQRQHALNATRDELNAVTKPLEIYWIVYVFFSAPAVLMSFQYCQNNSVGKASNDNEQVPLATLATSCGRR
eukprot:m.421885 g.421885  ORF g.421885 m.421885 type:complete len:481 (+) comp16850_c0_seq5:940-2382(+)